LELVVLPDSHEEV